MNAEVLDSLEDLGYIGKYVDESNFDEAVSGEDISEKYSQLVSKLVGELIAFYALEEASVSPIQSSEDIQTFLLEVNGFIREYGCPHKALTEGSLSGRLDSPDKKLLLLCFLTSELQSARILAKRKPNFLRPNKTTTVEIKESELAKQMRFMLKALEMNKPPDSITAQQFFSKLEPKVSEKLKEGAPDHLGKSLLKNQLTEKQWSIVENVMAILNDEYKVRRELLLKRLDVTIQSFKWSEKARFIEDKIAAASHHFREQIRVQKGLSVANLLAARDDLLRLTKTASGDARERSSCRLNKVLMGRVPDRGGRAWELEPPPPEMPSFQKRDAGGDHRGGRGGGRGDYHGGGRGGRGGKGDHRGGGRGGYHQDRPQTAYHDQYQQNSYYQQQGANGGWRPQSAPHDAMGMYAGGGGGAIIFTPDGGAAMCAGGYQFQPQYEQSHYRGGGGGRGRGRGGRGRRGQQQHYY